MRVCVTSPRSRVCAGGQAFASDRQFLASPLPWQKLWALVAIPPSLGQLLFHRTEFFQSLFEVFDDFGGEDGGFGEILGVGQ